ATPAGQKVCEKIRTSKNKKISIGNHTISHEGFGSQHSEAHIRQEIVGNESFMNSCDAKRVIKYFRYPKGSAHPLAEKVLTESGYLGTYKEFFPQSNAAPSKAVWWTTDTRDWVKSTGASAWAQIDYFNKNGKLLTVDKDSWRDLVSTLKSAKASEAFNQKISKFLSDNGNEYPEFKTMENIPGYHGPNAEEIAKKVLNDEGKKGLDGKKHCFPLMHYGGVNSFAAFKKIIPELKANKAMFHGLGDGDAVNYQLANAIKDLDNLDKKAEKECLLPDSFKYTVVMGDNIFGIARSMINTNKTICPTSEKSPVSALVAKIMKLNKITDAAEVTPGTILEIPASCLSVK
ncbi:MAG: polysaccharide deacetylase family protein, partial [Bdellovibrionales bacterium]|nr:polysaccharide deacetylase family protein [Bdellovibrionales bacterium]